MLLSGRQLEHSTSLSEAHGQPIHQIILPNVSRCRGVHLKRGQVHEMCWSGFLKQKLVPRNCVSVSERLRIRGFREVSPRRVSRWATV